MNTSAILGHRRGTRPRDNPPVDQNDTNDQNGTNDTAVAAGGEGGVTVVRASAAAGPGKSTGRPSLEERAARSAPAPGGERTWLAVGKRVKSQLAVLSVPLLASGVAFWAILSIFPAVIAVITVYGLVASPQTVRDEIAHLSGTLSPSTSTVLQDWLTGITTTDHSGLGVGLLLSLVGLMWAVSSGTQNLIKAVSVAFEQEETRGPVRLRLLAVGMSLGAVVVAVLVIGGITAGGSLLSHHVSNGALRLVLTIAQWIIMGFVLLGAVAALYRLGPAQPPKGWRWASIGAVGATVALIVASVAFSFYVRAFGQYNKTYGALGGVVILMLWLYYAVTVVLVGALVNAEIGRERDAGKPTAPQPHDHPRQTSSAHITRAERGVPAPSSPTTSPHR
ncbi:YihY/virulence factor BrkB family protein [Candidatus Frankia nodulisporulans]|uniref:YihY/virulence factor BrkB family protein n=1 Tax=Candidatus Frankia nodulisporulans TaxID=2060052 RepID=UPI001CDC0FBE|nr:YihY/virulence factor BrkB family protein [Candidatus Frankia nodulisporulans]